MMTFFLLLSAGVGLVGGLIATHLTHDPIVSAVVAVVVTLLTLFLLSDLMIKAVGAACDPPRKLR